MENNLAENIRSFRKSLGFTQDQLAERPGITLAAVSKWERGSSEPDLPYIMELAGLFHVSVDALIKLKRRDGLFRFTGVIHEAAFFDLQRNKKL